MKQMKGILKTGFRIALTLLLFLILFGGIGKKSHETVYLGRDADPPFQGVVFLERLKKREYTPLPLGEVCETGKRGKVYFEAGGKRYLLDTSFHCEGEDFMYNLVMEGDGDRFKREISRSVPGERVYLRSHGFKIAPVSLKELLREVRGVEMAHFLPWILFAILAKTIGVLSSLLRWAVLLAGQGIRFPFFHLMGTFFVGRFFGMFLPSTIGLDGYRLYDTIRFSKRPIECTAVVAIEKVIGIISLTFIVFITLPLGTRLIEIQNLWLLAAILLMLLAFVVFFLLLLLYPRLTILLIQSIPLPFKGRFMGVIQRVVESATAYHNRKGILLLALFLGFLVHTGTILMYVGTMMAIMPPGISPIDILFAAPLMIYGTVIGPTIGGEGIREGVFVLLLGGRAGGSKSFLIGHLGFWIAEVLLSLPGIFFYLLRPSDYKPRVTIEDLMEIKEGAEQGGMGRGATRL